MSIQTRKTFVHLQSTNEDVFDEIRELSEHAQNWLIQGLDR